MARSRGHRGDPGRSRSPAGANIVPLPWLARRKRKPAPKHPHVTDPDDYPVSDRTLLTIAACLALLVLGCVWLLETMHKNSILEDCLMAGRKNCSPIAAPPQAR
jgi:hypothetical protein